MGDYYFLIPIVNGKNHSKVFNASIIYSILNLFILFLQINYSNLFFILSIINALVLLFYFKSFKYEK